MLANVGQEHPAERILQLRTLDCGMRNGFEWQAHRAGNLISLLSILFQKHDMSPRRCAEMAGVVVRISRPNEAVIRHLVPFFARDFASLTADANGRVGEKSYFDVVGHVRMTALIRAVCAFADHGSIGVAFSLFLP